MDTAIKTNTRNLTLECCKLMAACFVVFLHIPFPGDFGALVVCLSRFAVPLFFAVSGWYSYEAAPKKLARRLANILLLELMGDVLYIGWRCIREVLSGEVLLGSLVNQVPDGQAMKLWLLWNVDPFAGHLWYLSATALCYILLLLYHPLRNKSRGYQPLYFLGGILLAGCFCMGEFSGFTGISVDVSINVHVDDLIMLGYSLLQMGKPG